MASVLQIKNMVCPRCISAVQALMDRLDLRVESIKLGEVVLKESIGSSLKSTVKEELELLGFELLGDKKSTQVNRIKAIIINEVHYKPGGHALNLSQLIATELNQDYPSLSRLFSSVEGITIERFTALQRIEKVKELLIYDQLRLAEISDYLGLSSAAYVSNFFKKETGMSPSQFKKGQPNRKGLDQL